MGFSNNTNNELLYGIQGSGWTSPSWNWGYAQGTGHDCAKICRRKFQTQPARRALVEELLLQGNTKTPFEEVKLVLALAWQRGRWDGSDGGPGGYGEVLQCMADAQRYEVGTEEECSLRLIEDMKARFVLLDPHDDDAALMKNQPVQDYDASRRQCSGLVLKCMGFIENGI